MPRTPVHPAPLENTAPQHRGSRLRLQRPAAAPLPLPSRFVVAPELATKAVTWVLPAPNRRLTSCRAEEGGVGQTEPVMPAGAHRRAPQAERSLRKPHTPILCPLTRASLRDDARLPSPAGRAPFSACCSAPVSAVGCSSTPTRPSLPASKATGGCTPLRHTGEWQATSSRWKCQRAVPLKSSDRSAQAEASRLQTGAGGGGRGEVVPARAAAECNNGRAQPRRGLRRVGVVQKSR